MRAIVLGIVCLFAFILLFPTFRAYLAQEAQNASLRRQVAAAEATNAELTAQLARWNDQAYVIAQARERLAYVLPGETAYRVVDPQAAPPLPAAKKATSTTTAGAVDGTTAPWYATLWGSVEAAGQITTPEPTAAPGDNGSTQAPVSPTPAAGAAATGAP